jgi:signal transduction histidine kinase
MGTQEWPMAVGLWLEPPRRVLTSFLVVVVACVATLAWLGHRLLQQDRAVESQRTRDQLEAAADRAAAGLDRRMAALEGLLNDPVGSAAPPDGTVLIVVRGRTLERRGAQPLLFYPALESPEPVSTDALRRAETAEFLENSPSTAARLFRDAARAGSDTVRAAALVGLGRNLRKAGRTGEALAVYDELAALGSTVVAGLPAELVAREARCSTFETSAQPDELRREADALMRDLESGRWRLTRSAYEFRVSEARRWMNGTSASPAPTQAAALSTAVETLVDGWRARPELSAGRRIEMVGAYGVLTLWRSGMDGLSAIVAGPQYLAAMARDAAADSRVGLALTSPDGRVIAGQWPKAPERAAVRTAAATRLPWTIHVSGTDPGASTPEVVGRRRLLLAGLSVLTLLLLTSSYLIVRAMTRELAVARLQSEFVASVSHEFRSPLTSLRQLSSMLVQGRLPSDRERQRSYEFIEAETGRLQRLVEGLLDFGLTEAGETRYRLAPVDARDLVRDTVGAFQRTVSGSGYKVELSMPVSDCGVRADRDALGRALWNLLDNAVKYSPDNRTVRVDVAPQEHRLAVSVSDQGVGIPASEQQAIFRKFVRGASSREAGIRGTGIGLAMVKHIVVAHGGEIRLESAPGAGSRFTILLPMETDR